MQSVRASNEFFQPCILSMGSKHKLRRFQENDTFSCVLQPAREEVLRGEFALRGRWREDFFKNENPVVLELGCGKGEYTIGLAAEHPEMNFIGVDIKGARLWRGAKTATEDGMPNVAFLRTQIELIDLCFAAGEVDEIWITFPDPQTKYRRTKHRLTGEAFLEKYAKILKPEGLLHLKTDSAFLHGYTLGLLHGLGHEVLYAQHDLYRDDSAPKELKSIQTFYEKKYLEVHTPITYIRFRLKQS